MEKAALELELERIHTECWGWALACCGRDRDLAEDTLQSAYLKILSKQAEFDGRSSFRTWVFGVIRRTAMEELRRHRTRETRERGGSDESLLAIDPALTADAVAEMFEERAALLNALAKLSARQREVLQLVFYHDMTINEAAAIMHVSLGSARTHYDRGKKALAHALRVSGR
jgi:RNA polymerase sigma-70 factor (ECF subfamily)